MMVEDKTAVVAVVSSRDPSRNPVRFKVMFAFPTRFKLSNGAVYTAFFSGEGRARTGQGDPS